MTVLAEEQKIKMIEQISKKSIEVRASFRMLLDDIPRLFQGSMSKEELEEFVKEFDIHIQAHFPKQ